MMHDKDKCRNVRKQMSFTRLPEKMLLKNMKKFYHLTILCILLIKGMITFDGNSHLDLAFQKALRCSHHWESYKNNLQNEVIPSGLRIKKQPAFIPTKEYFHIKWDTILYSAERKFRRTLFSWIKKSGCKDRNRHQQPVNWGIFYRR